jgi:hypothetical protein
MAPGGTGDRGADDELVRWDDTVEAVADRSVAALQAVVAASINRTSTYRGRHLTART